MFGYIFIYRDNCHVKGPQLPQVPKVESRPMCKGYAAQISGKRTSSHRHAVKMRRIYIKALNYLIDKCWAGSPAVTYGPRDFQYANISNVSSSKSHALPIDEFRHLEIF